MKNSYKLINIETQEIVTMTLEEILNEINRDRSDSWQNYDETDWKEGLEVFTEYKLLDTMR
jgi:hypothetical protein